VVENADEYWVETFDERIFPAVMLGASGDIAVLQIEASGLVPAEFGDAGDLGVGSFVAAIGNSYGFACGLAWGEVNGFRPDGTIQLSLGVSAGSSGGAIVDTKGRVVGLIKAKISEPYYLDAPAAPGSTGSPFVSRRLELPTSSVSLAIPVGTALRLARNVSETGAGAPAYVGVYVEDLTGWQVEHFKTNQGVLVIGVVEGTPADRYGLASGDIIRAVGSDEVNSVRRFRQVIAQSRPGERITFDVLREGRPLRVMLEMARGEMTDLNAPIDDLPQSAPRAIPIVPVTSDRTKVAVKAVNTEGIPVHETSSAIDQRAAYRDTDARLQMLERVVDSLMHEIQTLRRQQTP
jgi:serine protease Do